MHLTFGPIGKRENKNMYFASEIAVVHMFVT